MKLLAKLGRLQLLWEILLVVLLFAGAFGVRLYHLTWPVADWHSFRQADTASVTREYVKHGVDFLHPHYQDLSNIQSGHDNLQGWRMVEFPLVNGLLAYLLRWQPGWDLVIVSRLASIAASMIALVSLYVLTRGLYGKKVAVLTAFIFAFLPYCVYYSRSILPEPFLVMFIMLTAACLWVWSRFAPKQWMLSWWDLWLSAASLAWTGAILMKPMAIFYTPLYLGIIWRYHRFSLSDLIKLAPNFFGPFIALWRWRVWILQFPSGIPVSDWLYNGNGIRLRPAWWRWLFADRLGRLQFGYWGAPIVILGAFVGWLETAWPVKWPKSLFARALTFLRFIEKWLAYDGVTVFGFAGALAYLVVFATGNVQHDYYQYLLMPILALGWARAVVWIWNRAKNPAHQLATLIFLTIMTVFTLVFAWSEVSGFYHINNPAIISAGKAVDRLTPPDAVVIAPYFGDTAFLFATNRRGWPIGFEIPDKISKGAQYYVTTSQDDEANALMKQYPVMEQTKEYILLDLQHPLPVKK